MTFGRMVIFIIFCQSMNILHLSVFWCLSSFRSFRFSLEKAFISLVRFVHRYFLDVVVNENVSVISFSLFAGVSVTTTANRVMVCGKQKGSSVQHNSVANGGAKFRSLTPIVYFKYI